MEMTLSCNICPLNQHHSSILLISLPNTRAICHCALLELTRLLITILLTNHKLCQQRTKQRLKRG